MSDLSEQYLVIKAKAIRLKERFRENNEGENIENSDSFLAEDWRICMTQMGALSKAMYIEYNAKHGYPYIDCAYRPRTGRWKRNPYLRSAHVESIAS
jgi:hypothetical protein